MEKRLKNIYNRYEDILRKELPSYKSRNFIAGQGPAKAKIMLVAEAPGATEDKKGVPLCGPSGSVLDRELARIGIHRKDVFVTNVFKFRPPANRVPNSHELGISLPLLTTEIQVVKPKLVILLGRIAAQSVMGVNRIRMGVVHHTPKGNCVFYTFHPAATLYDSTNEISETFSKHFDLISEVLQDDKDKQ